jgi:hypothetical protein
MPRRIIILLFLGLGLIIQTTHPIIQKYQQLLKNTFIKDCSIALTCFITSLVKHGIDNLNYCYKKSFTFEDLEEVIIEDYCLQKTVSEKQQCVYATPKPLRPFIFDPEADETHILDFNPVKNEGDCNFQNCTNQVKHRHSV